MYINRRAIDAERGWARIECTAGNTRGDEDLLAQIRTVNDLLANELPMVSGSSLVVGHFNFSCKYLTLRVYCCYYATFLQWVDFVTMKLSYHRMIEAHITGQKRQLKIHVLSVSWTASIKHRKRLVWLEEYVSPITHGGILMIALVHTMDLSVLQRARSS